MLKSPRKEYNAVQKIHTTGGSKADKLLIYSDTVEENERSHENGYVSLMKKTSIVIVSVALPLLLLAVIIGWILVPCFLRYQISNKVVISPDVNPELYKAWIHPPVPVYLKVYLFNVTNPDQVKNGELPKLQEVGPYVFRENRTKIDINAQNDEDTITYKEYISYHFEEQLSGEARLGDKVTIINVPFVAAAIKISQDLPWPLDQLALTILKNYKEDLFIEKSAEEALFKGWKVPFLEKIESGVGFTLIPNNTFGFFIGQNDTAQGPYTISRGTNDKSSFGTILKFKNESELTFWPKNSSCNKLQGTDGTIFSPFVNRNTVLRLFNAELCRSLYLTYEKDTEFEGIKGYRFIAPSSVLKDPRESDENRCFCLDINEKPENCLKQGALDLGPCREGAPVALSTPYFLDANVEYITSSGLTADRAKHETYMIIEPLTGLILDAGKKIQINLNLKRVSDISSLSRVPELLFPLVWADECASLDQENAQKVKSVLFQLSAVDLISKWGVLGVTIIICLILITKKLRLLAFGNSNKSFSEVQQDCNYKNNHVNENNEDEL